MNPRTILTMANGKGIDLLDPKASDIDFAVIAEHLAKANRYCGATNGLVYSVAEHSVRCAEAILSRGGSQELAAYLLCHDMHEAFFGDDTTPKKRALDQIAATSFGVLGESIKQSFDLLVYRMDAAIHEAAGLQWPPRSAMHVGIKTWDQCLLKSEWRDLMKCPEPYNLPGTALPETISPLIYWTDARDQFLDRCRDLLPAMKANAA